MFMERLFAYGLIGVGVDFGGILDEQVDLKRQENSSKIAIWSVKTLGVRWDAKSD